MSKKKAGTALVRWDEELALRAKESTAMVDSITTGNFISVRAGQMAYHGSPVVGNKLNVVILDAILENAFYEGKFDPDDPQSPVCFAYHRGQKGEEPMAPHELSEKPQYKTCKGCKRNDFGSDLQGRRGKACKNIVRLGLIPADVLKDKDQIAASEVAYFKVPVTSVKAWAAYVKTLDAVYHRHPMGVVTELSVVPDVKNQLAVIFTEKGIIKDSGTGAAILQKAAEVKQAITFPYVKFERTAAPKKGKKKHSKKY